MARIADEELERIKREVSLQRLVEAGGIGLKRHGKDLIGLCPFHDDKEPSLVITPEKNLWHYLGACRTGGSVIDWVMKSQGVGLRHAVELLRQDAPSLTAPTPAKPAKRAIARKLPPVLERDADDQELGRQVVTFYHDALKQSPEALAYLDKRGLKNDEAIDRFRLGYANRTLGYRLGHSRTRGGAELRARLQQLGLYRASGHEHFNGSLVIPVFDEAGNVTEMYGRKLGEVHGKRSPTHLYLPGPHRGVWNVQALAESKEVILCESLLDALTFWCAGYHNVTASYGIEGFTKDHREALARYGTERVLLAYDRDDPGERAAAALAEELVAHGIDCYRVQFPRGMDANEYALQGKPATKSLGLVIRKAVWLGKGEAKPRPSSSPAPEPEVPEPADDEHRVDDLDAGDAGLRVAPEPNAAEPAATPVPRPTPPDIPAEVGDDDVVIRLGSRHYRIRGIPDHPNFDSLKVNLRVAHQDPAGGPDLDRGSFLDRVDLYAAARRAGFARQAAVDLGINEAVILRDLGKVLCKLEQLIDERSRALREPTDDLVAMTDDERAEALALLKAPDLLDRILADFERCGVVGEQTNKLTGYLAAVSRKLDQPLAILIQSTSAAGKSSLLEAVLAMVPEEERLQVSAMTDQSLYYMGAGELRHKVLAIAEEEGASRASYALKLLQSEGRLNLASTTKNPDTGMLETRQYQVEGPVMLLLTTTAIDIDEELKNRCIVLTVDEERDQTRAIHRRQRTRQTLAGLLARREADQVRLLHRNAQRLLRPLFVANPYAERLTFLDDRTRTRRDHLKYLTLIRAIAFLRQHQRPVRTVTHDGADVEYIEVTLDDVDVANRLAHQVLGCSLDELAPPTRRLLLALDDLVAARCAGDAELERADVRFTRREVREHTGWSQEQLRVHLARLVDLEYVLVHAGRRGQSYVYELVYNGEGRDGAPFLMGLVDVDELRQAAGATSTTGNLPAATSKLPDGKDRLPPSNRPHTAPIPGGSPTSATARNSSNGNGFARSGAASGAAKVVTESDKAAPPSYVPSGHNDTGRPRPPAAKRARAS